MDAHNQRLLEALDALELRASAALRCVPGAQALLLFGSRVSERHDPYADLDLHLVTANLGAARAVWPYILGQIGPLEILWPLTDALENTAFSVLFAGESAYHKLDISLGSGPGLPAPLDMGMALTLWEQQPAALSPAMPSCTAYCPDWGSYGHLVVEELLSSMRYLKARKRGHPLMAWRFVRSKPDLLLRLLAAQHTGVRYPTPLSTWAIKQLETILTEIERAAFFAALDWRTPLAIDESYITLTRQIVQIASALAEQAGDVLPQNWIERQLAFLTQELGCAAR